MKLSRLLFLSFVVLFFLGISLLYFTYSSTPHTNLPDERQEHVIAPKPTPEIELSIHEHPAVELDSTENRVVNEQEEVQELGEDPRVTEPQNVEQVWLPINPSPELAELKPKSQAITEIQAIEFDNIEQFRALMEGDTATLLLPNGESIQVVIDESQTQNQGVQTWAGNFESQGSSFPVTFTFGQNAIMGFIGHPQGSIKIEGSGHQAWVYQVPDSHGFEHDTQSHDRAH
ncbi:hypothetical protein K9823_002201 [Vibrio cholerae]|nr:hypothetical protein [Vibrio cholerae]EJL6911046.1 hypothetical protein [Vibrio cholerae]